MSRRSNAATSASAPKVRSGPSSTSAEQKYFVTHGSSSDNSSLTVHALQKRPSNALLSRPAVPARCVGMPPSNADPLSEKRVQLSDKTRLLPVDLFAAGGGRAAQVLCCRLPLVDSIGAELLEREQRRWAKAAAPSSARFLPNRGTEGEAATSSTPLPCRELCR